MFDFGAVGHLHGVVKTSILLSGPAVGGERRAREELSSQSNLRVASAEEGDLLFRVEQKGKREFVTGDVAEGAMTVSNPVCFMRKSRACGCLPSMAALPSSAQEAEVAPAPLPACLLLQQLSHEGWAFWRLSPTELSKNHGNGEKNKCSVTAVPYSKGKVQTLGAPLHYVPFRARCFLLFAVRCGILSF